LTAKNLSEKLKFCAGAMVLLPLLAEAFYQENRVTELSQVCKEPSGIWDSIFRVDNFYLYYGFAKMVNITTEPIINNVRSFQTYIFSVSYLFLPFLSIASDPVREG